MLIEAVQGLTLLMILIHAVIAAISFRYSTVPRSLGVVIATYESFYYALLLSFVILNHYPPLLPGVVTLFLLIHVGGAYAYLRGYLGRLAVNHAYLRYYGYYEVVEMAFLILIAILVL